MISAVGLSAAETAASVRAGTARFIETSMLDKRFETFVLAEVPEEGLPDLAEPLAAAGLTAREARMLRLATPALKECLQALPAGASPPALMLALPETETTKPLDGPAFLGWLAQQVGPVFDLKQSAVSLRGRAAGLQGIGRAADLLRSGAARFAIAGGIDTYRDLYVLGTLDMEQRVKSTANLDGFIPGEGAAFLLLASRGAAPGLAALSVVSQAVEQLIQGGGVAGSIEEVYSSMNGENHWAKEWGVARIRQNGTFSAEHGMHHPADCCGDTGAACGPLLVGLAALGIK